MSEGAGEVAIYAALGEAVGWTVRNAVSEAMGDVEYEVAVSDVVHGFVNDVVHGAVYGAVGNAVHEAIGKVVDRAMNQDMEDVAHAQ